MAKDLIFRLAGAEYAAAPVKLERKKKMTFGAKWENIYERLLPEYGMESGNTIAPTTGVYDGEGNFVAEIDGLAELEPDADDGDGIQQRHRQDDHRNQNWSQSRRRSGGGIPGVECRQQADDCNEIAHEVAAAVPHEDVGG